MNAVDQSAKQKNGEARKNGDEEEEHGHILFCFLW